MGGKGIPIKPYIQNEWVLMQTVKILKGINVLVM